MELYRKLKARRRNNLNAQTISFIPSSTNSSISAGEEGNEPKSSVQTSIVSTETKSDDYGIQPSVFDDPELAPKYWPRPDYEGIHRFVPDYQWTAHEEKLLVRKIDLRICLYCCIMFFALQLDRFNIGNALSETLLPDLNMTTNDYNYGQTIFYLSFLLAELPSQMVSKRIGPDNWIPIQMVCWSIIASSQAALQTRGQYFACRALLGLFEGGFIPDIVLYLSYFYKSNELPRRLSYFWSSYVLTNILSAFFAYGILHMRGLQGLAGWRWLFALEGILTAIIGIVSWFYLPPSPTQTASRFRGKNGWFSEREETILVTL